MKELQIEKRECKDTRHKDKASLGRLGALLLRRLPTPRGTDSGELRAKHSNGNKSPDSF